MAKKKMNDNQIKAIEYINKHIPIISDKWGVLNTDREIVIDFIRNPKDTCLFGKYQVNIYNDLVGMFNLPPIKKYENTSDCMTWVLA